MWSVSMMCVSGMPRWREVFGKHAGSWSIAPTMGSLLTQKKLWLWNMWALRFPGTLWSHHPACWRPLRNHSLTNITKMRSFFGLVNQVSFAFSMKETMVPFRELLWPSAGFYLDGSSKELFEEMQRSTTTWCELLNSTGGTAKPEKSLGG